VEVKKGTAKRNFSFGGASTSVTGDVTQFRINTRFGDTENRKTEKEV
jgi:hypothetical protein